MHLNFEKLHIGWKFKIEANFVKEGIHITWPPYLGETVQILHTTRENIKKLHELHWGKASKKVAQWMEIQGIWPRSLKEGIVQQKKIWRNRPYFNKESIWRTWSHSTSQKLHNGWKPKKFVPLSTQGRYLKNFPKLWSYFTQASIWKRWFLRKWISDKDKITIKFDFVLNYGHLSSVPCI